MKKLFKSYWFDGILMIGLGVAVIILPESMTLFLVKITGGVIGVMGIVKLYLFITEKNERNAFDFVAGILQMVLGVGMVVKSDFFLSIIHYIIGIILLYGSILMFIQTFRLKSINSKSFVPALVFSVLTLICAVVIFVNPPAFDSFILLVRGISLIVEGLLIIIFLRKYKEAKENIE